MQGIRDFFGFIPVPQQIQYLLMLIGYILPRRGISFNKSMRSRTLSEQ
jgi:hypothetical protein